MNGRQKESEFIETDDQTIQDQRLIERMVFDNHAIPRHDLVKMVGFWNVIMG